MLSFKALSEKKTKITLNPKLKDVMEKHDGKPCPVTGEAECKCEDKKKCPECDGKGCKHCGGTGYHSVKEKTPAQKSVEGKGGMTEAKKKDDTYLETDFKKRQKNNEKARKDLMKGPQMKNPHFESTEENAYVSQEEVSEESTKESETETFLTFGQFTEGLTDLQRRRYLGRREGESKERLKRINDRKVKKAALASLEKHAKGMKAGIYDSYEAESELVDEATRAAKEGKKDEHRVGVAIRAKQSATTLAAKRARQKVLDDYEKKTGKKLDISKSPEGKTHAKHFGGSRQAKKVKGKKETPAETHNRRVGKNVARIVKHGYTSKEKKEVKAMAKQTSRFD